MRRTFRALAALQSACPLTILARIDIQSKQIVAASRFVKPAKWMVRRS